jgi:hypothetical protein
MEGQIVIINGKARKAKMRYGREFIRKFYDLEVNEADYFCKKCDLLGKTDTAVVRDLILDFNRSFGLNDDRVKDAGSLYERRSVRHIKEAVKNTVRRQFPWIFNEN